MQGFEKGGGKAGQTHFRVLLNPKHSKSTLRCLSKSKPAVLAHLGWQQWPHSQSDTSFPNWGGVCIGKETGAEGAALWPGTKQGLLKPPTGHLPHLLAPAFQLWTMSKESSWLFSWGLMTQHNFSYMIYFNMDSDEMRTNWSLYSKF